MNITKIKYNMAKYIDKDAIVAEIKKLIEIANNNYAKFLGNRSAWAQQRNVCEKLLSFLDTLEVKEVDLEEEYEKYYEQERNIQTFKLAKYFFELGLQAKGE